MTTPVVSIVTATYNRSNVLRHTIDSVLASTFTDWEMIVVGDACTDDTAAVVASFGDPRLRFVNLAKNCGEQSGPNNEGARLARGPFVAYLNHDDLWMPDHLTASLAELARTGADLVFTMSIVKDHLGRARLAGVPAECGYDAHGFTPASNWTFRRELVQDVGPWKPAQSLWEAPSVDWLRRVVRSGKRVVGLPEVTVLAITSGGRRNCYADRHAEEHEVLARRLRDDPDCVRRELTRVALELTVDDRKGVWRHLARAARNGARPFLDAVGVSPRGLYNAMRYRQRGGFVDHLRRIRGLSPLRREESL